MCNLFILPRRMSKYKQAQLVPSDLINTELQLNHGSKGKQEYRAELYLISNRISKYESALEEYTNKWIHNASTLT
jgi:hypothetical protein